MFYIAAISLAFFLTVVLVTKRGKTKADSILAGWLLIVGTHLTIYYASGYVDINYRPYLVIFIPLPLVHGPMLYFYTASLTGHSAFIRKWIWHFVPCLLVMLLLIPFFTLPQQTWLIVFSPEGQGYMGILGILKFMVLISGVVYVWVSSWLLYKHRQRLPDQFSEVEKINLNWLRYLVYGIALIWIAVFYGNDFIIFSLVSMFVIFLGYFGVKQVGMFTEGYATDSLREERGVVVEEKIPEPIQFDEKPKYLRSTLSDESAGAIHLRLKEVMTEHKMFLDPELTLADLADKLEVQPHHLSQVINSAEGKTFYDYVNSLRIEEFKRRVVLPENSKYTLLGLAFESGFNSKTAFNRNFKNVTGMSPGEWVRSVRKVGED